MSEVSQPHSRVGQIEHYFDILFASRDNGRFEESREYERNIIGIVRELEEQLETAQRERDSLAARLRAQGYNVTEILAFDAAHNPASEPKEDA